GPFLECGDGKPRGGGGGVGPWLPPPRFRNTRVPDPAGKELFAGFPDLPVVADQWLPATDPPAASELHCLKGHRAPVTGVAFTGDGRHLVSCSEHGRTHLHAGREYGSHGEGCSIRLWDPASGKLLHAVPPKQG